MNCEHCGEKLDDYNTSCASMAEELCQTCYTERENNIVKGAK